MKKIATFLILLSFYVHLTRAQTVTIGKQVWGNKNLNVITFRNGDTIPEAKTKEEWDDAMNNMKPAWCYYDNDPVNGAKYGKLYNWFAVNDQRGLAPKGWHIPTNDEWTVLSEFLGGAEPAAKKMKSKEGWDKNGNGTDESGFSALPAGNRGFSGSFIGIGGIGLWWSSTENSAIDAWSRNLICVSPELGSYPSDKKIGISVRCIKD